MKVSMIDRVLRTLTGSRPTTRLVALTAMAGMLFAACSKDSATSPASAGVLATIVVTPGTPLAINATQQFVAVGKDANGNVVVFTPTWSVAASGGTRVEAEIPCDS